MNTRNEFDLLGDRAVPSEALYGIHTDRAIENFPLTRRPVRPEWTRALALVKRACAETNSRLGLLEHRVAEAIIKSCDEVMNGRHDRWFVTDSLQGGAGTSLNMNLNEVLANRASQLMGGPIGSNSLVHPIDHVNLCQSTNDVVPTAARIAIVRLTRGAADALKELQEAFQSKEREFADILKVGRTELQDAAPMTLGQTFGAWAQAIQRDWWRMYKAEERVRQVNIGGTVIGTGLNAPVEFTHLVTEVLAEYSGLGLARAENLVDGTQNLDAFVEVSGMVKAAAVNLAKISGDLRLLSSGPRAGFGELRLPSLQAGSSFVPGKVNPVIPEMVAQASYQIMACDHAVTLAAAHGQLELNAFLPLLMDNLCESLTLLERVVRLLASRCVRGIQADRARCGELVDSSLVTVSALAPFVGHDAADRVARHADQHRISVRDAARELSVLDDRTLDHALDPRRMTRPADVLGRDAAAFPEETRS